MATVGIVAILTKKARECTHAEKVGSDHPQGPTLCIGCAVEGVREYLSKIEPDRNQFVINTEEPEGGPDEHPLEWYLR